MARPNYNTKMARAFFRHYEHKHHIMAAILANVAAPPAADEIALPAGFAVLADGGFYLTDADGSYLLTGAS